MKSWCEIVEDDGSITKARLVVMSTKDYMFRNRANYVTDWFGEIKTEVVIPDNEVICNGCNSNMYPDSCFGMEYSSQLSNHEWKLYDVYCDACCHWLWEELPRVTRDELHNSEKYK